MVYGCYGLFGSLEIFTNFLIGIVQICRKALGRSRSDMTPVSIQCIVGDVVKSLGQVFSKENKLINMYIIIVVAMEVCKKKSLHLLQFFNDIRMISK